MFGRHSRSQCRASRILCHCQAQRRQPWRGLAQHLQSEADSRYHYSSHIRVKTTERVSLFLLNPSLPILAPTLLLWDPFPVQSALKVRVVKDFEAKDGSLADGANPCCNLSCYKARQVLLRKQTALPVCTRPEADESASASMLAWQCIHLPCPCHGAEMTCMGRYHTCLCIWTLRGVSPAFVSNDTMTLGRRCAIAAPSDSSST